VHAAVVALRQCRTLMVQTEEQYFFVYRVVLDGILALIRDIDAELGSPR
jgi:protein tyrosine phosphatase